MKKLIYIVGSSNTLKGFFDEQIEFMKKYFDVSAITSYDKNQAEIARKFEIPISTVNIERNISLLKDIKSVGKLYKVLRKEKPDIVHSNTPKVALISMIAAYLLKIPVRIYMCHGLRYESENGLKKKLLMFFEKLTCSLATHVVCVSSSVMNKLKEDDLCVPTRLYIINKGSVNGVSDKLFTYSISQQTKENICKECGDLRADDFVFCFIGRLVKDKGVNELCRAFDKVSRKYSNAHLIILGNYEPEFGALTNETIDIVNCHSNIHHLGWKDDVLPFLAFSKVLILPSYREGLASVLLEAGALHKPAIITNVTGCKDIIRDEFNGKIIESPLDGKSEEMAKQLENKMIEFLQSDEKYREYLGQNAFQNVKENFSRSIVLNKSLAFYNSISK